MLVLKRSWHFWVCADEIKDVVVGGVTFMDRNIGATIAQPKYEGKIITATTGLIYQWGRKDPFAPAETLDGFRTIYDKDGKEITFTDKDGKEATAKIAACEVTDNIQNAIENPDTWYNNVYPVSQGNYSWITNNVETVDKDKVAKLWDNNGAKTMIVTKLRMGDANTMMAEGGIQAADKPNDSPAQHFLDAYGGGHFADRGDEPLADDGNDHDAKQREQQF